MSDSTALRLLLVVVCAVSVWAVPTEDDKDWELWKEVRVLYARNSYVVSCRVT